MKRPKATGRNFVTLCDMDFHLIDGVIEISAGVPDGSSGLSASLIIGGAGEDRIVPGLCFPVIVPEAPRIVGLLTTEVGRIPTRTAIGGDFDFHDVGLASPCGPM